MTSLNNMTQKRWVKTCRRLKLTVDKKKGKGSHYLIINPTGGRPQTLPHDCHKFISIELYKSLLEWGFSEEEVDKAIK